MKRIVLIIILIGLSLQYGYEYITSDKFQDYGDQTKAPWTCQANYYIGSLTLLADNPPRAFFYFEKTAARCPNTDIGDRAILKLADCYGYLNKKEDAIATLNNFIQQRPTSAYIDEARKQLEKVLAPLRL